MANRNVLRNSFAFGELSPRVLGRSDLRAYYDQGLRRCVNWLPDSTGALRYRGGTEYEADLGDDRDLREYRLIPFDIDGFPAMLALNTSGMRAYYPRDTVASTDNARRANLEYSEAYLAAQTMQTTGDNFLSGIWGTATHIYLADRNQDRIYAFLKTTRALDMGMTIDPSTYVGTVDHLWGDGTYLWMANAQDRDAHIYTARIAGGGRVTSQEFDAFSVSGGSGSYITGLTGSGNRLYVTNRDSGTTIFVFNKANKARVPAEDITIRSGAALAALWADNRHIYVARNSGDQGPALEAYELGGDRAETADVLLDAEVNQIAGMWGDGDAIYVAKAFADPHVYAYYFGPNFTPGLSSAVRIPNLTSRVLNELTWLNAPNAVAGTFSPIFGADPEAAVFLLHEHIEAEAIFLPRVRSQWQRVSYVADLGNPPGVGSMPATGTFFEQRLVIGGGNRAPQTITGSRTPDPVTGANRFTDWKTIDEVIVPPAVYATHAFFYQLDTRGRPLRILWMANYAEVVFIGCDHATYVARNLAPDSYPLIRWHSNIGSGRVQPAVTPFGVLHASTDRRRIHDAFSRRDLTAYAEHLFDTDPVKELAWSQNPVQRLWVLTDSGKIMVLTIDQENGVFGWSRIEFTEEQVGSVLHTTVVRSIATAPDKDGRDALWLIVSRAGRAYLEKLREPEDGEQADRCYLDASVVQGTRSTPTHLQGRTIVHAQHGDDPNARQFTRHFDGEGRVGIPYTADLSLPQMVQHIGGGGSALGEPQRIARATFGMYRSFGGRAGPDFTRLRPIVTDDSVRTHGVTYRAEDSDGSVATTAFSWHVRLREETEVELFGQDPSNLMLTKSMFDKVTDFEALLVMRQDQPQPFNLLCIEMEMEA